MESPIARLLELVEEVGEPSKAVMGKWKRFLFEQRSRALEALERFCAEGAGFGVGPVRLLDRSVEEEFLSVRVGREAEFRRMNEERLRSMDAAVAEGVARGEDFGQLADRVKGVLNG